MRESRGWEGEKGRDSDNVCKSETTFAPERICNQARVSTCGPAPQSTQSHTHTHARARHLHAVHGTAVEAEVVLDGRCGASQSRSRERRSQREPESNALLLIFASSKRMTKSNICTIILAVARASGSAMYYARVSPRTHMHTQRHSPGRRGTQTRCTAADQSGTRRNSRRTPST